MSEKTQKKSWFKGLSSEFKKIVWPDKMTLVKQTRQPLLSRSSGRDYCTD